MEINCKQTTIEDKICEVLIIGISRNDFKLKLTGNERLKKVCADFFRTKDFKGKANETALLYSQERLAAKRLFFVGLGEVDKYDLEKLRQAAGTAAKTLMRLGLRQLTLAIETFASKQFNTHELAQALTEGVVLATYQYTAFKAVAADDEMAVDEAMVLFQKSN
ncbi:MAG: M17 family peptidase N-terminal domain-containing protein, partial [bacterium]